MSKLLFIAIFISIIFLVVMKNKSSVKENIVLKENSVILVFGDSLTNGFGAGYVLYMERNTGLKVINAGIDGEFDLMKKRVFKTLSLIRYYGIKKGK